MLMILLLIISFLYKLNAAFLIFFYENNYVFLIVRYLKSITKNNNHVKNLIFDCFLYNLTIYWIIIDFSVIYSSSVFFISLFFLHFYLLHHYFFTVIEILIFFNKNIKMFQTSFFSIFFINITSKYIILLNYNNINK